MDEQFTENDSEVIDALFGEGSEGKEDEFEEYEQDFFFGADEEQVPQPVPAPVPQPEPQVNHEVTELQAQVDRLKHQITDAGLTPEMTDAERMEKLAAGGMDSDMAREMIDTFEYNMTPEAAKAMVENIVSVARSQNPNVKFDNETDVDHTLRTTPELAQLQGWMNEGGDKWQQAIQVDNEMQKDPKWANVHPSQRFIAVQNAVLNGQTSHSPFQQANSYQQASDIADPNALNEVQLEEQMHSLVDFFD